MRKILSFCLLVCLAASMHAQVVAPGVDSQRAHDPNQVIGEALKTTGTISLAVGVPCLAAGVASLMYANFLPNPVANCTTSSQLATAGSGLKLISVEEYNKQAKDFSRKTHAAEVAGYVMTPLGGALTIVGIPLYVKGNKMLQMNVQYTGNGAGVAINF